MFIKKMNIDNENISAFYMILHRMIELNNPDIPFDMVVDEEGDCFVINGKIKINTPEQAQELKLEVNDFISYMFECEQKKHQEKEYIQNKNEQE